MSPITQNFCTCVRGIAHINKLILKNVVINNNWKTNNAPTWYPAAGCETIAKSQNAFIINAHNNAINNAWAAKTNFTEIINGNTLTSDLSGLDATYWSTTNNRPAWRGAADTAFSSIVKVTV